MISIIFYLLLSFFTASTAWFTSIAKSKFIRCFWGGITILTPTIVAAIRYNVGTDYSGYVAIFNNSFYRTDFEIGFTILISVIKTFTNNSSILFLVMHLIIMAFFIKGILNYKDSINVGYAVLVFMLTFYFTSLNITRQFIAMAILFYSFKFLIDKKIIIYLIYVLVATSFHTVSIIFLPIYFFLNYIKIHRRSFIILSFILSILILFNLDILFSFITSIFPSFSYYQGYFIKKSGFDISLATLLLNSIYLLIGGWTYLKKEHNRTFNLFMILYVVGAVLSLSGTLYVYASINRIALLFTMTLIYIVPYMIKTAKNKLVPILLISNTLLLFIYEIGLMNYGEVIPYKTFFY